MRTEPGSRPAQIADSTAQRQSGSGSAGLGVGRVHELLVPIVEGSPLPNLDWMHRTDNRWPGPSPVPTWCELTIGSFGVMQVATDRSTHSDSARYSATSVSGS
jgi:hypothetical protein